MTATSSIHDRGLSESEMREEIARKDRDGWYPSSSAAAHHIADGSGRIIVSCGSASHRDMILAMARNHDAMVANLAKTTTILADFIDGIQDMRRRAVIDESNDGAWLDKALADGVAALKLVGKI